MTAEESMQAMFDGIDRDREQQFVHSVEDFHAGITFRIPPGHHVPCSVFLDAVRAEGATRADYGSIYLRLEDGAGSLKGTLS